MKRGRVLEQQLCRPIQGADAAACNLVGQRQRNVRVKNTQRQHAAMSTRWRMHRSVSSLRLGLVVAVTVLLVRSGWRHGGQREGGRVDAGEGTAFVSEAPRVIVARARRGGEKGETAVMKTKLVGRKGLLPGSKSPTTCIGLTLGRVLRLRRSPCAFELSTALALLAQSPTSWNGAWMAPLSTHMIQHSTFSQPSTPPFPR